MTSPQSDDHVWQVRRNAERDAAGLSAAKARQVLINALNAGDDKLARVAALAYSVLVDKAEALTVGDDLAGKETSILDDLAARRDARLAATPTSAARRSQPRRRGGSAGAS